jgi:hypothetical protein
MSALPKTVDYSRNIDHASKYKTLQVPLSNNSAISVAPVTNNSQLLQWKLPAGVTFNLSRSSISYNILVDAPAPVDTKFAVIADDCFQIANQLSLVTAQGITVADVPFCNRYTKLADKYFTRHSEFMSRANVDMSYPCRSDNAGNPISLVPGAVITANTYELPAGVNQIEGFVSWEEPKYYKVSKNVDAALAMAKYQKLGDVGKGTLFEQDKDLYFGQEVYLNLQTAPVDSWAFRSIAQNEMDPFTNGSITFNAAGKVSITNIMLNLAVEDNALLANSVRAKYEASGINLRTDYILAFRNVCNNSLTNINLQIPQMSGTKLKRIMNAVYNSNETGANTFDCHNLNGEKITTYQTTIDSQTLQNAFVDCTFSTGVRVGNTDYRENEKYVKDSVIQTIPMYQYNWTHIDSFDGDDSLKENHQNRDYGLDLDVPRNYLLQLNTPNAPATNLAEYSFCILSRMLHIGKDGIVFV